MGICLSSSSGMILNEPGSSLVLGLGCLSHTAACLMNLNQRGLGLGLYIMLSNSS